MDPTVSTPVSSQPQPVRPLAWPSSAESARVSSLFRELEELRSQTSQTQERPPNASRLSQIPPYTFGQPSCSSSFNEFLRSSPFGSSLGNFTFGSSSSASSSSAPPSTASRFAFPPVASSAPVSNAFGFRLPQVPPSSTSWASSLPSGFLFRAPISASAAVTTTGRNRIPTPGNETPATREGSVSIPLPVPATPVTNLAENGTTVRGATATTLPPVANESSVVSDTRDRSCDYLNAFVAESSQEFPLDEYFMAEMGFVQTRTGVWTMRDDGEGGGTSTTGNVLREERDEKNKVDTDGWTTEEEDDGEEKLLVVYEKEPPDICLCTICQGVLKDPVQLPACPHVMCRVCIESWLSKSRTCPTCRAKIPVLKKLISCIFATKTTQDLRVHCPFGVILAKRYLKQDPTRPNSPLTKISLLRCDAAASGLTEPFVLGKTHRLLHGGCTSIISRRDLDRHVTECDQRPRDCVFGCGMRGPPDVLDLHRCCRNSDKLLKKEIRTMNHFTLDLTRKASSTCLRLRTENDHLRSRLDLRNPDGSFIYNSSDPFQLALRIVNLLSKDGLVGFAAYRDPIFRSIATMWLEIRNKKDRDFGTLHGMKTLLGILLDGVPERAWGPGQLGAIKLWKQDLEVTNVKKSRTEVPLEFKF